MRYKHQLKSISDKDLLHRLSELLRQSRRIESELVAHIDEVDERRLFLDAACSSMFAFCTEVLNLSEAEAYLRINVARASRKHPMLLEMLGDGRLHLSGIIKLVPHLTEGNRETLLARASGKTKRQIEELVAEIAPKPDVPSTIRKLPERREKTPPTRSPQLSPGRASHPAPGLAPLFQSQPLAPARYKVEFTASAELHDKLERLRTLMRPSVPDGDFVSIIEEAVTEKLERLESKRFGKTNTPRKGLEESDTSAASRHIPAAVKRVVYERDGGQCTFEDRNGRRCANRHQLEFHHQIPYGRGGDHSADNISLLCTGHNGYLAELDYGRKAFERQRRSFSGVCESELVYGISRFQLSPDGVATANSAWPLYGPVFYSASLSVMAVKHGSPYRPKVPSSTSDGAPHRYSASGARSPLSVPLPFQNQN